jgi:RNA polymerase sigma factor (TIGR02999 family)
MEGSEQITNLLNETAKGNREAESSLLQLVYDELHRLASNQMRRERNDHTLQPTALLNEAYMRLFDQRNRTWANRSHFFAVAAKVMRNILIDHARRHTSAARGSGSTKVALEHVPASLLPSSADLIALDDALNKLAKWDERQVHIVELRFFAGLTEDEIGKVLGIATRTVKREWAVAKAWLQKELASDV